MEDFNVRIVDSRGHVDSAWLVRPGDIRRAEWSIELLADYRREEPGRGWFLQTRGSKVGWHRWDPLPRAVEADERSAA